VFEEGYLSAARPAAFLPDAEEAFRRAVAVFELEKAAYEIVYEANHRPDWVAIPLRGVVSAARMLRAT
jgi:maltose alpha-D-glucosyltransferase/alpha-amylase